MIEDQISSLFLPLASRSLTKFLLRTLNEPVQVFCVNEFAAKGSIPGEELPAIIEIEAVGAMAILLENLSSMPASLASGQAPRYLAISFEALSTPCLICINIFLFQTLLIADSIGTFLLCKNE